MTDRLWVTWETQRRNDELADSFACQMSKFDFGHKDKLTRFIVSAWKTSAVIFSRKWAVVFAQYPSLYLVLLLGVLSKLRRFVFIIDAHNTAIEQFEDNNNRFRSKLTSWVFKQADFIIVSNSSLVTRLDTYKDKALILPDKVPALDLGNTNSASNKTKSENITLISTFAADEPIEEFIRGFIDSNVSEKATLYITGRKKKAGALLDYQRENIVFTDFLPERDYISQLENSTLLVDLTTRESCLVCGAYEALSVGVPILLSDTEELKTTFPIGTLFSNNNSNSYSEALEKYFEDVEGYRAKIKEMKNIFENKWKTQFQVINEKLNRIAS